MTNIIKQTAYCLTYGYVTGNEEPSLIQNSPLITNELIEKFSKHPKIKLLTLSTGSKNIAKSIITFTIPEFNEEQYNLFITQMSNNSKGLYSPELHTTTDGSFILISTNNREELKRKNDRLQRWVLSSFDVISNAEVTTRNFVKDNRENYNLLTSHVRELKNNVNEISKIVDVGQDKFTETQQTDAALGKLSEQVAVNILKRVFQTTAVRDIKQNTEVATSIIKRFKTNETELSTSHIISNFDNTTNNILKTIEKLSSTNPEAVKKTILNELSNLKDVPKQYMDYYTNNILDTIDKFPFSSIDTIKELIVGHSNELSGGPISDGDDFITTVTGELLTATNTSMEKFAITAASSIIEQISQPGVLENMVRGFGTQSVKEAKLHLPIEDIESITNDIKTFSNYVDLGTHEEMAESYTNELIDFGLNTSDINNLLIGIDNQLYDFDKALTNVERENGSITGLINSLSEIGPTLQNQFTNVSNYAVSAFDLISKYNIVDSQQLLSLSSKINSVMDMSNQFYNTSLLISRSCGAGNPPGCIIKYGIKDMGLV